jgi:hypothetical protein
MIHGLAIPVETTDVLPLPLRPTGGLAAAQRWFQDVVTDPDGVDAGLARAATAGGPEAIVHGSPTLSSRDRLALYGATYHRRLIGCLRESYPGLRHALGGELFDDFAADYLRLAPPRSYTLASLGAAWPEHLEATRPDHDLPDDQRELWPDFLVDLAILERTFCEVYDAHGAEGQALPTAADLPVDADGQPDVAALRVTPVVCLRLLDVRFPVDRYLVAVRRGEDPPLPAPAPTSIAVSRRDYVVTLTEIGTDGRRLLDELADGACLADAAQAAGLALPEACLLVGGWADRGLIASVQIGRPTMSRGE